VQKRNYTTPMEMLQGELVLDASQVACACGISVRTLTDTERRRVLHSRGFPQPCGIKRRGGAPTWSSAAILQWLGFDLETNGHQHQGPGKHIQPVAHPADCSGDVNYEGRAAGRAAMLAFKQAGATR